CSGYDVSRLPRRPESCALGRVDTPIAGPAEAGLRLYPRPVLAADPAVIADRIEIEEQHRIVDLLTAVRLVAARHAGDLHMPDDVHVVAETLREPTLAHLH